MLQAFSLLRALLSPLLLLCLLFQKGLLGLLNFIP
jgi:hypothetical protein